MPKKDNTPAEVLDPDLLEEMAHEDDVDDEPDVEPVVVPERPAEPEASIETDKSGVHFVGRAPNGKLVRG